MTQIPITDYEFLAAIPKAELHIHIEGAIQPNLLFEMADRNGITLPYKTPEDIQKLQHINEASSSEGLINFLKGLDVRRGTMRKADDYYDVAIQFLSKCKDENIVYSEVMFDPQQAMRQGVAFEACVEALMQAQKDGESNYGVETQWIMNFQRDHPADEAIDILGLAGAYREFIIGVGLDNAETNGFPDRFKSVFNEAKTQGYRLTSHCDVNQTNTNAHIRGCLETLKVERIDHGLNIAQDETLIEVVVSREIGITACPTFYFSQSSCPPDETEMIKKLFRSGAIISINSDDPVHFESGWLTHVLASLQKAGDFSRADMIQFIDNAFRSSWLDPLSKKTYLDRLSLFQENGATT